MPNTLEYMLPARDPSRIDLCDGFITRQCDGAPVLRFRLHFEGSTYYFSRCLEHRSVEHEAEMSGDDLTTPSDGEWDVAVVMSS